MLFVKVYVDVIISGECVGNFILDSEVLYSFEDLDDYIESNAYKLGGTICVSDTTVYHVTDVHVEYIGDY